MASRRPSPSQISPNLELDHVEMLAAKDAITRTAAGIRWTANEDWMKLGHSKLRVYRLETEILGQRLSIFASRAGEILRVDAPGELTLRNEAFSHL